MKPSSHYTVELKGGPYDGASLRYRYGSQIRMGAELVMQWEVDPATRYMYRFDGAAWRFVRCWRGAEKQVESGMPWGGCP